MSSHWAKDMIEVMTNRGMITGYGDGTFRPNETVERQHIAIMFNRVINVTPIQEAVPFQDISSSHPYYEAITQLQRAGIVEGSNGGFHPTAALTRAELAKMIVLGFGLTPGGRSTFQDVTPTHWSYNYIAVLGDLAIVHGDQGSFKPNEPVTRAEFTAMMYRAFNLIQ
ncbi:hypothetical protein AMS66_19900 [Paenibacillus xylanivorans]|uniref:SLH domain-containing protein n=1 Tax=Paenibacillus xylanivorans TaxID=1705561 RepID=A0A0M9BMV3_9BACL|nr:hypothetical protein AMS66_19900 [Paenibacillus xylanivorans]